MSLSKNTIKLVNSLRHKKFRQKYNIFIAEGSKICYEALLSKRYSIHSIYATSVWLQSDHPPIPSACVLHEVTAEEMKKITNLRTVPTVSMLLNMPAQDDNMDKLQDGYHLYLDNVQDPGNVGTLIRTAEWFGCKSVIRSPESADFYNSKVIQSTMGAFAHITLRTASQDLMVEQDLPLIITSMLGESIHNTKLPSSAILAISNEGQGVSTSLVDHAKYNVSIPKSKSSKTESLNAGLAGGILMSHILGRT